jgi:hypothetical protein
MMGGDCERALSVRMARSVAAMTCNSKGYEMQTTKLRPALTSREIGAIITGACSVLLVAAVVAGGMYWWTSLSKTQEPAVAADQAVLTYKADNARTGAYTHERVLTATNVKTKFGRRVSYPVDSYIYAQPLYVPGVTIGGHKHNVVYVATQHDSVYAFDADATSVGAPLWKKTLLEPGEVPLPIKDIYGLPDSSPNIGEIGITGTPVIDTASGTLYLVTVAKAADKTYVQRLHAMNLATGSDRTVDITATVPGVGESSANGVLSFDSFKERQRSALLLVNGMVYIAWASYLDKPPFHGWILAYDAKTLKQKAVFNVTPNGKEGGIWSSGGGLASTADGSALYLTTGNGTFNLDKGGQDAGDSVLKLSPQLKLLDYFAPFNQACMNKYDWDVGSSGVVVLPQQPGAHPDMVVAADKMGRIFLLDQHNLGHYATAPAAVTADCITPPSTKIDTVVQELPAQTMKKGVFSTPTYWQGPSGAYVFATAYQDHMKAFSLTDGQLSAAPTSQTPEIFTYPGGNVAVSSNGTKNGIAWIITAPLDTSSTKGALRAYDATDLSVELYQGDLAGYTNFVAPVIANGEVFVGAGKTFDIFGVVG